MLEVPEYNLGNQEKINVVTLWTVDSKSVVQAKGLGTDVVADR